MKNLAQEVLAWRTLTHTAEFTLTLKIRADVAPERYEAVGYALCLHAERLAWAICEDSELRSKGVKVSVLPMTVKSAP